MTGFGRGEAEAEGLRVQVEAGSVNRKNLDVHISLPRGAAGMEPLCQRVVSESCRRGRVQLRVVLDGGELGSVGWNSDLAKRALDAMNAFARERDLAPVKSVETLARIPGVWSEEGEPAWDHAGPVVERAVRNAVEALVEMREKEGAHLREVLRKQIGELAELLDRMEPWMGEARTDVETRLRSAVAAVGEAGPEVEQRLLQEIALLGEKADVREEADRLRGHVGQFAGKLEDEGPLGRGLDFLCQEMAREWNTLSVKTPHSGLKRAALEGKERVESLREQVQNVE